MLRKCSRCQEEKEMEEFPTSGKSGFSYYCKSCSCLKTKEYREKYPERVKSYIKKWNINNKEKRKDIDRKWGKIKREKRRLFLNKLKEGPCADCSLSFPPECMDFDHLPQYDKIENIGRIRSHKKIKEEIAKCELVCANCHRVRTLKRIIVKDKISSNYRFKMKLFLLNLKNKPCDLCKKNFHPCSMDFDHIDSNQKISEVATLIRTTKNIKLVEEEIAKCQLLCANCHRIKTEKNRKLKSNE